MSETSLPTQPASHGAPLPPGGPPAASVLDQGALMSDAVIAAPTSLGSIGNVGRYSVLRVIGAGGMGVVVLAREPGTERQLAIKLLRNDLRTNPLAMRRFLTEARHMSQLAH